MVEAQVFVKIEDYRDVLHTVGLIKDKLNEVKRELSSLVQTSISPSHYGGVGDILK